MRILIDGDGCPVTYVTLEIARENQIETIIFCDTSHVIEYPMVQTILVGKGSDAVDFRLVNEVQKEDIVVTQDYGLAAMVLAKGGYPIHQNGFVYTSENIDTLLWKRHVGKEIRRKGGRTKGPSKRTKEQDFAYMTTLRQLIDKIKSKA